MAESSTKGWGADIAKEIEQRLAKKRKEDSINEKMFAICKARRREF